MNGGTPVSLDALAAMSNADLDDMLKSSILADPEADDPDLFDSTKLDAGPVDDTPDEQPYLRVYDPEAAELFGDDNSAASGERTEQPEDPSVADGVDETTPSVDHDLLSGITDSDYGHGGESGDQSGVPEDFSPADIPLPQPDIDSAPTFEEVPLDDSSGASAAAKNTAAKVKAKFAALSTRTKALIIGGAVMTFILIIVLATSGGGGGSAPEHAAPKAPDRPRATAPTETANRPADLRDQIEQVSAKCGEGKEATSATAAFSTDDADAWVCPRAHGIDGAVLNIIFRQPVKINEIRLTPGYNYVRQPSGDDLWNQFRVVDRVLWRIGGKQFVQEIVPSRTQASFTLDSPITTTEMSLQITHSSDPNDAASGSFGTSPSSSLHDATAIQGIQIIGTVNG